MTTLMVQEKQRISERLARLDAEREKLSGQLDELEIAERVLARFGRKAVTTEKRRRASPARTTPAVVGERGGRSSQKAPGVSISDASLKAVQAHSEGATPAELLSYLSQEFGMTVRPNHLGAALQRHRRAGQLETAISAGTCRPKIDLHHAGDRGFESRSLHRGVCELSVPPAGRVSGSRSDESLGHQLARQDADTGQVAPWPCQTSHETVADRVTTDDEHDRDRGRGVP